MHFKRAKGELLKARHIAKCKKNRELDEKVTSWVKLTRLGTANHQRHPSKTTQTHAFTACISLLLPFGGFSLCIFLQFGLRNLATLITQ